MHKEHITALHLGGEDAVLVDVLILDIETEARALTVVQKPGTAVASDSFDTAMLAEDEVEIGSWIEEVFDEDVTIFSVVVELARG